MVDMHSGHVHLAKALAAVVGDHQGNAAEVNPLHVVGVDPHEAEIHRPGVGGADPLPGVTAIHGPKDTTLAAQGIDQGIDHVGVVAIDVEPDAALVALGESLGQLGPRAAAVHGAVDSAAWAAAIEAKGRAPALVHGGEQGVRVGRIHHQVDGPGVVVDVEDVLPGVTTILAAVHTTLWVGAPKLPDRRYIDDVVVDRVDDDAADVASLVEALVLPSMPSIEGSVDAVAPR